LPPLNPIQQMKSLILHIRQFFKQVEYGWSQLGIFFPSYSFLSPKFSLFCHHSSKIQIKKQKKNTSHNFTTCTSNQFIKHMQLKSFLPRWILHIGNPIKCATLASNKTIKCNAISTCKPPTILPRCQELVVFTE
jgi:hypothetical protein